MRVLLLFDSNLLLPDTLAKGQIIESAIREAVGGEIDFFPEALDALRLPGPEQEREFVALLLKRYTDLRPDLIVGIDPVEGLITRQRAALWPETPIMLAGITSRQLQSPDFPAGIPGTSVQYDMAGTVDLALRLQPDARRIVVVSGTDQYAQALLTYFSATLQRYRNRVAVEYLSQGSIGAAVGDVAARFNRAAATCLSRWHR